MFLLPSCTRFDSFTYNSTWEKLKDYKGKIIATTTSMPLTKIKPSNHFISSQSYTYNFFKEVIIARDKFTRSLWFDYNILCF